MGGSPGNVNNTFIHKIQTGCYVSDNKANGRKQNKWNNHSDIVNNGVSKNNRLIDIETAWGYRHFADSLGSLILPEKQCGNN